MAQKSSPYAIRVGYNKTWNNSFFSDNSEHKKSWLKKDKIIRDYFKKNFPDVVKIKKEHVREKIFVYVYITNISLLIDKEGRDIDTILVDLYRELKDKEISIKINLIEIKNDYLHAQSITNLICSQIKKRIHTRFVIKNVLSKVFLEKEIKGIKIEISGRLDGSEISQKRKFFQGKVPLSTIDSDIEVGSNFVVSIYGTIGVKVIIYKGKFFTKNKKYVNT